MGSEQSVQPQKKQVQRPQMRRGYTIASNRQEISRSNDPLASGNDSPGASVCSDSELPYISYTVARPIGDSPRTTKPRYPTSSSVKLPRRQSLPVKKARAHDIVVVRTHGEENTNDYDELQRLQQIPTFLPIMRGTLNLPGSRDIPVPLDFTPWGTMASRLQAHIALCARTLAKDQNNLVLGVKQMDQSVNKVHAQFIEKQRWNARHAERLARVSEIAHQLSRSNAILQQTLQDAEHLNSILPEQYRLEKFVWCG